MVSTEIGHNLLKLTFCFCHICGNSGDERAGSRREPGRGLMAPVGIQSCPVRRSA
jgi:hypothetical protein